VQSLLLGVSKQSFVSIFSLFIECCMPKSHSRSYEHLNNRRRNVQVTCSALCWFIEPRCVSLSSSPPSSRISQTNNLCGSDEGNISLLTNSCITQIRMKY
jgi:hypothetical protein